jgi:thiamine-phosphate pyrophosphorylase
MHPDISPGTRRAFEAGEGWSVRLSAKEVEPLHILLGLLEEEEGRTAQLFLRQGLAPAQARTALVGRHEPEEDLQLLPGDPFEHGTVRTLAHQARQLVFEVTGERTVTSQFLLLALLRHHADVRAWVEALGIDVARMEGEITGEGLGPPPALDEPLNLLDATEEMDALRILDAAANRAREALRTLEDYCRFVLDDRHLAGLSKTLRHDLDAAFEEVNREVLITARDTVGDVGTNLATLREGTRTTLGSIVRANAKRLQEALRSLEEFGKLHSPRLGALVEQVRYRSYTLERCLLLGLEGRRRLRDVRLYLLVTGATCHAALDWTIREAVAGGVTMVQLREKTLPDAQLLARARELRKLTRELGVLLIINDRPDIARLVEADGVHLGQTDLDIRSARRIVGAEPLVGVSTHSWEQVEQAIQAGASYLGVGPTFASPTKAFDHLPGLEFVRWVASHTTLPAFAIGGITPDNVQEVVNSGITRVAVSSAITQVEDPRAAAARFKLALRAAAE